MAHARVAGVDEAGRGPWAGPVLAAAVILHPQRAIAGLADSKTLAAAKRARLALAIKDGALAWAVACASVEEIDTLNILRATLLAMRRAVLQLPHPPTRVLVDGCHAPELAVPVRAQIKGDRDVAAISAASILAKVERDHLMDAYHQRYPDYAFHRHKGYGTRQHSAELKRFGPSPIHRLSFAPVRKIALGTGPCR